MNGDVLLFVHCLLKVGCDTGLIFAPLLLRMVAAKAAIA